MRRVLLLAVVLGIAAAPAARAQTAPLTMSAPAALPGTLPGGSSQRGGGEPSATFDPRGRLLYAASTGAPDHGGNFWRSTDGGRTFGPGLSVGSLIGGGDSDLAVGYDAAHTVFYIDLEDLVASDLCRSTDEGRTFPADGCSGSFPSNQQDPAADRPWVNTAPGQPGLVYDTYDGLAFGGGAPEVARSTDNGSTFAQCGQVLQPGSSAFAHFSPTGALENSEVIGKPAIAADGSILVPFTEPHQLGQQVSEPDDPTPSNLYLGISRDGCRTFHDTTIYEHDQGNDGSDFVSIFPSVAIDGAGTVYVLGTGRLTAGQVGDGVYLFVSRDGGEHFGAPIQVNAGAPQAAQLAALAAGPKPGQVLVGWYAATNTTDHNSTNGQWRYLMAQSRNSGATFSRTTVTPSPYHYGAICNLGVECTGGRILLDFTTVATNPVTGCAFAVFAGDPFNAPNAPRTSSTAAAYTSYETSRCTATSARRPAARRHRAVHHRRHHHRRRPRFTG